MDRIRTMRFWMLLLSGVGFALCAPRQVWAQGRVDNGNVLDASNRIGSGGYNTVAPRVGSSYNTDIFNGNATGPNSRSLVYRPPDAFWGGLPYSPSQVLLQQSGGNYLPNGRPAYGVTQPYFSDLYTNVNVPQGLQAVPYTGTYSVAPSASGPLEDARLGVNNKAPTQLLPGLGEATGPGAVDPSAQTLPGYLVATPFYGVQAVPGGQLLNSDYLGASGLNTSPSTSEVQENLTPSEILQLRAELARGSAVWQGIPPQQVAAAAGKNGTGSTGASAQNNQSYVGAAPIVPGEPIRATANGTQPLGDKAMIVDARISSGQATPINGKVSTGQSYRQSLPPLPTPAEQSPQYVQLKQRLDKYQAMHPANDEQANQIFQAELRLRRQMIAASGKSFNPEIPNGGAAMPESPSPTPQPQTPSVAGPSEEPLHIHSIGQSISAPGLSKLIDDGEAQARNQKYRDAIAKFREAESVAPNNYMIVIDLAEAELGAGFYEQANDDLRDAYNADPALMMGRFDINSVISDNRVQVLIADLKRVGTSSDSPTPVFLLAFISYNMGEPDKALSYLKMAQTRAGGQDELIGSLIEHWSSPLDQEPETQPAAQ
jgi:hypothetical protein